MKRFLPLTAVFLASVLTLSGCGLIGGDDNSGGGGREQTASDAFCDQVADGDGFVAANTFDQSDPDTLGAAVDALGALAAADAPEELVAQLEELSDELAGFQRKLARELRRADGDEEISEAILDAQVAAEFNLADWQARLLEVENAARESCGLEDRTIETPDAGSDEGRDEGSDEGSDEPADDEPADDEATTTTGG